MKFVPCHVRLLILLLLTLNGPPSDARAQGFLHASGIYIVDGNNNQILLRGIGLGGWLVPEGYMLGTNSPHDSPTGFRQAVEELIGSAKADEFFVRYRKYYVARKDIDSIALWGFNSIRLPFHYGLLSPSAGVYSEAGFAIIDSLLAWCEAKSIYLILDMHCAPGGQNTGNISDYQGPPALWESAPYQQWTAEIWKEIARRYAAKSWIGGYDLLNETAFTFAGGTNKPLRDLFVRITDSIRTVDSHHIIFAEGNSWASDFSGLAPAWDTNMAWSFHKYWNDNTDPTSILSFMTLRGNTNVPLWMGESGENSNQWFADAIAMFEKYNIGWSWWTLKKIESITCPLSAHRSANYNTLLNYWNNGGTPPGAAFAEAALTEQAILLDASACTYHADFIDALFRLPHTTARKPFAANTIPGTVHAVNYDMGRNNYAYYDIDYQNTGGINGTAPNQGWSYRNDGVDIEPCSDLFSSGYNVGWTAAGEFLAYSVQVQTGGLYNVKVRVSSGASGGTAKLTWDGAELKSSFAIPPTGGWQAWTSVDLGYVTLTAGAHDLMLNMVSGGFNVERMEFSLIAAGVQSDEGQTPRAFALEQNYPNPFNPSTVIRYSLPQKSNVLLCVYNMLGQPVRTLVNREQNAGSHEVRFDATGLASGIYFYSLRAGEFVQTRKLTLIH